MLSKLHERYGTTVHPERFKVIGPQLDYSDNLIAAWDTIWETHLIPFPIDFYNNATVRAPLTRLSRVNSLRTACCLTLLSSSCRALLLGAMARSLAVHEPAVALHVFAHAKVRLGLSMIESETVCDPGSACAAGAEGHEAAPAERPRGCRLRQLPRLCAHARTLLPVGGSTPTGLSKPSRMEGFATLMSTCRCLRATEAAMPWLLCLPAT